MASKRAARRSTTTRIGMATAVLGALLAVTSLSTSTASADTKVTVCHRSNSAENPYQLNDMSINANGEVVGGPDHSSHGGEVFDFEAYAAHLADPFDAVTNPDGVPNPYPPPHNGDQWGDIIPAYDPDPTDADPGYPGLNWTEEGMAIHAAGCVAPPVDVCPEEGVQTDESECVVDVCPEEGVQTDESQCVVDVCPEEGVQTDESECPAEVEPNVIPKTPSAPAAPAAPPAVGAAQAQPVVAAAAAELPRTGSTTTQLTFVGLGLVLIGAGLIVSTRLELCSA